MKTAARRSQVKRSLGSSKRGPRAYERQAERAAVEFVRGGARIGTRLTPASPAGFRAPGSRAEQLPRVLLGELESAFDANLSAVRIHRDAAAANAAHNEGARAFTAGSHVYFGSGTFAPDTAPGRLLIAHELAHVLQQTARPAARHTQRATTVTGDAPVQRTDDPFADEHVPFLASGTQALTTLAARHAANPGADESTRELISLVKRVSGGDLPRHTVSEIGTTLIDIAVTGQFDVDIAGVDTTFPLTVGAQGFLIDCLKVCALPEHFEAAAGLLDEDLKFEIRSAFGPRTDFRNYLLAKRGEDWVAGAFKHPSLGRIWPDVFLSTFKQYAFSPGRPRQTLYFFEETKKKEFEHIDGTSDKLLANDRVAMGFALIEKYDGFRTAVFKAIDEAYAKKGIQVDMPTQRLSAASHMVDFLREHQRVASSKVWGDMLGTMAQIAMDAAAFWTEITNLRAQYAEEYAALGSRVLAGPSASLKRVFAAGDTTFQPLHRLLSTLGAPGGLYNFDAAGQLSAVPEAAEYERRVGTLGDALGVRGNPKGNVLLTLQMELISRYGADPAKLKADETKAIGLAIWWLLDFRPVLLDYRAKSDTDAKRGFQDRRLAHRYKIAWSVIRFAEVAGWADVLASAARIPKGEDVPRSYLITRGWDVLHDVGSDQMVKDFGSASLSDHDTFTADDTARFFHADTMRLMSEAIYTHLDAVKKGTAKLDVTSINEAIRHAGRPWKCEPVDPIIVLKADDPDPTSATAFNLISNSAKTKRELRELATDRKIGDFQYAALRDATVPLFTWIFPNTRRIIKEMRRSEPFIAASALGGLDGLADEAWMAAIIKQLGAGEVKKAVSTRLQLYAEGEQLGAEGALREFTIHNRRDKRERLATELRKFAADRSVTNFEIPTKVVKTIDMFAVEVRPPVDSLAQTSLLVLSLAPELDVAFTAVRHAGRLPPLFHHRLTQAVAFADQELAKAVSGDPTMEQELTLLLFKQSEPKGPADEQFQEFYQHRNRLDALAKRIEAARLQIQESMGFESDDGVTLKSINFYPRIKPGRNHAFEMDGEEWELVQVHRKFMYHPALSMSARTDKSSEPVFKNAAGKKVPVDDRPLITFLVNGLERDVPANDAPTLQKLSEELSAEGFSREMENLASGLEAGAMFIVDVIELIPGVGQKLMLARLAAQTGVFLTVELPIIADAVKKDPALYIEDLGKKLTSEYLTVDNLLRFIILGSGTAKNPFDSERRLSRRPPFKTKPRGKLGRMMTMLRKLGMRLADAMQWLQVRVRGPMRALQSAVATRPQLAWLLRRAIDIALWVRDMVPPGLMQDAAGKQQRVIGALQNLLPGDTELPQNVTPDEQEAHARGLIQRVEDQISAAGADFKTQLEAKLDVLGEAELPEEIVPLPLLTSFVLDFFLGRLGAKVRVARSLLEHTDAYRDLERAVSHALADEVRGTNLDPNVYWRSQILDKVDEQFVAARNGLVDGIYGLTDEVFNETKVAAFRLERPAPKSKQNFGVRRTPFPEEELELAPRLHGEVPSVGTLGDLPTTEGQPLAATVRRTEETRFGHDFRHVRVHEGGDAGEPLADLRADAATAGSHVFLRPGLSVESGKGARLLRHELTHVLQQAGKRPLGSTHSAKPVRGRPGEGLTIDTMREAAAETMARADANVAAEPIDVDQGAAGIQPSLESVAVDLLKTLTELGDQAATPGGASDKDPATVAGRVLWQSVRRRLAEKKDADFLPFVQPVAAAVSKHVEGISLEGHLSAIGKIAQQPLKGARGQRPKTELDFPRLVTLLEGLIFRETGIAMQIKAKVGPPLSVDDVKVTYVHLGWVLPGTIGKTPLWDQVMHTPGLLSGDDPAVLRLELHERLRIMAPEPFIWKTARREYRFSEEFVEAFGKLRASRRKELTKELPVEGAAPSEDPSVKPDFRNEYLNPSTQSGIGLRIGHHGGIAGLEKQAGMDRESHHTTQYLLVQFFRNDNRIKAWTAGTSDVGIHPKTGVGRDYFESKIGRLQLEALDKGGAGKRGTHMPAILIAADTHRRAQLHVEKESQWKGKEGDPDSDDDQGRATQGFAISAEWKRQQLEHVKTHQDASDWQTQMKLPGAADKVHAAMLGTYQWMNEQMMHSLERGLMTRELAYYRAVASRKPHAANPQTGKLKSEYDLTTTDLKAVFARAKRHNNEEMAKSGWKARS